MTCLDDPTVEKLAEFFTKWTGFTSGAISRDTIRQVVRSEAYQHLNDEQLLQRARNRDPDLMCDLRKAILVSETYFFRQTEHFDYIAVHLVGWPSSVQAQDRGFRVWSAGCATGEEAYSLAAFLLAHAEATGTSNVRVLGTDLLESNVAAARGGTYGRWSTHASMKHASMNYSVTHPMEDGRFRVNDRVRAVTSFAVHNLLDPPPNVGLFDLILCRNVLVYFSAETTQIACTHLASALAPGGVVMFGPMDVVVGPRGLVRVGTPELNAFARPTTSPSRPTLLPPKPRRSVRPARGRSKAPPPKR